MKFTGLGALLNVLCNVFRVYGLKVIAATELLTAGLHFITLYRHVRRLSFFRYLPSTPAFNQTPFLMNCSSGFLLLAFERHK